MASKFLLLLGVVSLMIIPLKVYGQAGIPYTHDGENHLARFANYKQALREGQFPPRFAPNLMNRYGYPVFNYNYPLPSILSVPLTVIGLSYVLTFKIIVSSAVVFGAIGLYLFLRQSTVAPGAIFIAESVYLLNPYLIGAILYRGSIGEVISISLFPWLWWSIKANKDVKFYFQFLVATGLWTAFLLAHNVGVLIGVPILVVIAIFEYHQNLKAWRKFLLQLGAGIGLSLWFWLPAMWEKSAIILDQAGLSTTGITHFPDISQLLFSPQQFGFSFPGSVDSLSFSLGLLQISAGLFILLLWLRTKLTKQQAASSSTSYLWLLSILILGQLSWSSPVWEHVPFIRFIQFPWRLTMFLAGIMAVAVGTEWRVFRSWMKVALIGIVVIQGLYFWRLRAVDYRYQTDVDYEAFSQSTTTANENLPKGFTYLNLGDWQPSPQILVGDGELEVEYWTGSDRKYNLTVNQPSVIVEPTMQFLGWQTLIENDDISIKADYFSDPVIAGRIAYRLEPGQYRVRTRFTQQTPARMTGNTVSLMTAAILLIWITQQLFIKKRAAT